MYHLVPQGGVIGPAVDEDERGARGVTRGDGGERRKRGGGHGEQGEQQAR